MSFYLVIESVAAFFFVGATHVFGSGPVYWQAFFLPLFSLLS
jgi:hypothetical protein